MVQPEVIAPGIEKDVVSSTGLRLHEAPLIGFRPLDQSASIQPLHPQPSRLAPFLDVTRACAEMKLLDSEVFELSFDVVLRIPREMGQSAKDALVVVVFFP